MTGWLSLKGEVMSLRHANGLAPLTFSLDLSFLLFAHAFIHHNVFYS